MAFKFTIANESSKLRTYRLFKSNYCTEKYLSITMPGKYRSAYAKFRAGVAPIKIETGRYEGIDVNERFCFNCRKNDLNIIEDEKHVLLECPEYADLRTIFFNSVCNIESSFSNLSNEEKFLFMFHDDRVCYFTAKICHEVLFKRKCILYS